MSNEIHEGKQTASGRLAVPVLCVQSETTNPVLEAGRTFYSHGMRISAAQHSLCLFENIGDSQIRKWIHRGQHGYTDRTESHSERLYDELSEVAG